MTGCTPGQLPVLSGIARDFAVFDHWSCEVPSQTFMNRSFWTAATSSGFVGSYSPAQVAAAQPHQLPSPVLGARPASRRTPAGPLSRSAPHREHARDSNAGPTA
jgi:Phosphoesterase family